MCHLCFAIHGSNLHFSQWPYEWGIQEGMVSKDWKKYFSYFLVRGEKRRVQMCGRFIQSITGSGESPGGRTFISFVRYRLKREWGEGTEVWRDRKRLMECVCRVNWPEKWRPLDGPYWGPFEIGDCHSVVDQLTCWWYSVAMLCCFRTQMGRFGN